MPLHSLVLPLPVSDSACAPQPDLQEVLGPIRIQIRERMTRGVSVELTPYKLNVYREGEEGGRHTARV